MMAGDLNNHAPFAGGHGDGGLAMGGKPHDQAHNTTNGRGAQDPSLADRGNGSGPHDQAQQLLEHLHRGGSFAYWWVNPGKVSTWWAVSTPAPLPGGAVNLYFGVHPAAALPERWKDGQSIPLEQVRATIPDIAAVNCLFAEFDDKDHGGDHAATLARVDALPVAPSVIVDSGGGYHAYWLFRVPFLLITQEDRDRARRVQAAWVAYVGGDPGAKDLARVLRVPGSRNLKYDPPRPVGVLRADYNQLYNLPDLETLSRPAERPAPAAVIGSNGRGPSEDDGAFWLGKALDRAAPGNRNDTGFWLACQLRDAGLSETDSEAVMLLYAARVPQGSDPYTETEALASNRKAFETDPRDRAQRLGAAPQTQNKTPAGLAYPDEPPDWIGNQGGTAPQPANSTPAPDQALAEDQPPAPSRFEHLTDLGNARRLVARHGDELRYCHPWAKWLVWDGRRWTTDSTAEAVRRAKETVRSMYAEAAAAQDEDARKALGKHALKCEAAGRIDAMLTLANSEPGIPVMPSDLDANPWTLNVLNGAIDLRTGQLSKTRRQDLITKLAPVIYDPDAQCPLWERFLLEVMGGDQELVSFLQRAIGYTLTGDTSEQVIFILHGKGANGKSTLLETLRAMLGEDYTVQIRAESLMVKQGDTIPNDIARLKGARLVNARETEEGKRLAEALVKEMTGGDTMTARFMRGEFFDFKPEFKLFLAANHKPTIRGTDLAIWRRIRLIPFDVTFPEDKQDKQLAQKLRGELPGILAWAVRGCQGWQVLGGLGTPAAVKTATEQYRSESDALAAFLEEYTVTEDNTETQAKPIFEAYKSWCEANGEKWEKQTMFGRRMKERFDSRVDKSTRLTFYLGLRLVRPTQPEKMATERE